MGKRGGNVLIDKDKLTNEIRKRGLNARQMSLEMGYCQDYISTIKYEGKISPPGMKMLQMLYNITPEDIAPDVSARAINSSSEEKTDVQEVALILTTETINRLEEAIYRAFKRALHE